MSDVEFKDQPGSPANQKQKEIAQEAARKAKVKKSYKSFVTEIVSNEGKFKLVRLTAKPNGAQSIFIAKKPKADGTPGAAVRLKQYEDMKKDFAKKGEFVAMGEAEDKINEMIAKA